MTPNPHSKSKWTMIDRKGSVDTGYSSSHLGGMEQGEYSLDEQPRPITPPKELFYDSGYNIESDPDMKNRLRERHRKTQEVMQTAGRSIMSVASSDDD